MMNLFISKKSTKKTSKSKIFFIFLFIFALTANLSFGLFIKQARAENSILHNVIDINVEPLITIAKGPSSTADDFDVNIAGHYDGTGSIPDITDYILCAFKNTEDLNQITLTTSSCGSDALSSSSLVVSDTPLVNYTSSQDIDLFPNKDYYLVLKYEVEVLDETYYGYSNPIWITTGNTLMDNSAIHNIEIDNKYPYPNQYDAQTTLSGYATSTFSMNGLATNSVSFDDIDVGTSILPVESNRFRVTPAISNKTQSPITVNMIGVYAFDELSKVGTNNASAGKTAQAFQNKSVAPGSTEYDRVFIDLTGQNKEYYITILFSITTGEKTVTGFGTTMKVKTGDSGSNSSIINANEKQGFLTDGTVLSPTEDSEGSTATSDPDSILPVCSTGIFPNTEANWSGCFAVFFYYVLFKPAAWVMGIAGSILDFGIYYSTKSSNYDSGQVFIQNGWKMTRDISNLLFIFVILFNAIQLITGSKGSSRSILVSMILVGIFINFSLFAGRVIIDAGNILSRVMYNAITITGDPNPTSQTIKPLSAFIVQKFNPQSLILSQTNDENLNDLDKLRNSPDYAYNFMILSIAVGVIALLTAWLFFTCGFVFIGRTVTLWLYLILAPFAFISQIWKADFLGTISQKTGIDVTSIGSWAKGLAKASFAIVVFLFFIVLIIKFTNGYQFLGPGLQKQDFVTKTLNVLIPFIFIYFMLTAAKNMAVGFSGEFGKMVEKAGKAVTGAALTAASFATGLGATRLLGAAGAAAESKFGVKLATSASKGGVGGWLAKKTIDATRSAQTKEFNFSKTKLGELASKNLGGSKLGAGVVGALQGTGRAFGADMRIEEGFKGAVGRQTKRKEAEEKRYSQLSDDAAKANDKRALEWERAYQNSFARAKAESEATGRTFNKDVFNGTYFANNGERPKSAEQINLENQRYFAERQQNSVYKGYREYADKTLETHRESEIKKQQSAWDKAYLAALQTKIDDIQSTEGRAMTDKEKDTFKAEYTRDNGNKPMTTADLKKKQKPEEKEFPKEKEFKQNAEKINKLKIDRRIVENHLTTQRANPATAGLTERQLLDVAYSEVEAEAKRAKSRINLLRTTGAPATDIVRAQVAFKNLEREKAVLKNKTLADINYEIAELEEKNKLN